MATMSHCEEKGSLKNGSVSDIEPFYAPHLLAQDEGCNECFENIMDCSCDNSNNDQYILASYYFCSAGADTSINHINETNAATCELVAHHKCV